MKIYVDVNAKFDGDGSNKRPFKTISEAAQVALPGDKVLVAPGVYRENVKPVHAGTEEDRIVYKSVKPLAAVVTGAEEVKNWERHQADVWLARIKNGVFGDYNPYTTYVFGDWYFATRDKHTGCVWLNDEALYEATTLEDCLNPKKSETSWVPEKSLCKWYTEQDEEKDETLIYANFGGIDPNEEKVEITVRRQCFMPEETGIGYITVKGFDINKAATTWAPPAAYQDGMIGPHWSKGWIIEECDIWGSKCAGISIGKYLDPENNHYFTTKHVKSPTQMERDAVCRGQYHGWIKEKVGSHIIRRNNIHHCEQGGIIGRMGGVFSLIEDNHIHHINNMMELGGAEIAGIKIHAAIDITMRRNHIHHCTMGIWTDWEAQGTRISQNLLHDNQKPAFAKHLPGGMMSMDLFVEVSHGPTLIDNNILLSDVSLRFATQGVALVHNLIAGSFTCVGDGTGWRYTPYHFPHQTEVMGFMTILHGDNRFYNNIFVQKWPKENYQVFSDSAPDEPGQGENREVGTHVFDDYPTYDEWISHFQMEEDIPNMRELEQFHFSHLPIWAKGNAYLAGAEAWKKERDFFTDKDSEISLELVEEKGQYKLQTNLYDVMKDFRADMVHTETLGKAFEPDQAFENNDGTPISFNKDYFGNHRGVEVLPGPFARAEDAAKALL